MKEKGRLFVISGPSGAGKSTVVALAMQGREDVCFSVSVTTRQPRPGEVDGKDYFFITRQRYDEMVAGGELLEHAQYVSNGYGTPREFVINKLNEGINVILDIEVQGARQVKAAMPDCVPIFVVPPSIDELKRRLEGRGTETEETINARLERARQEYKETEIYDYIIINDSPDHAAEELKAIMLAQRCKYEARKNILR